MRSWTRRCAPLVGAAMLGLSCTADDPTPPQGGGWAPEGRLACEGWDDSDPSRAGIYTVRASDGSDPRRLTRQRDIPCEYSPMGRSSRSSARWPTTAGAR